MVSSDSIGWPIKSCRSRTSAEYWFKVVGSDVEVEQLVGGTRGTDYVYIEDEQGFLTNVKYLPEAKLIAKEKWGRNRRKEVYKIPLNILNDKLIMRISFSNSGYASIILCKLHGSIPECYLCHDLEDVSRIYAGKFKIIGGEKHFVEFYLKFVTRLGEEIKSIAKRSGAEIFFGGKAERLRETLEEPYTSLLTSMAIDTWQGRILSLQEKVSHVVELWVLAKLIEAIDGETASLLFGNLWYIEFTKNMPFAYVRSKVLHKEYTIFYQPSILPHIISAFLPTGKKRLHLIPDIVVFEGIIGERVDWGQLHKLIESGREPKLVIEVKTGLETTEWGRPEYIAEQLKEYKAYLQPKHMLLVAFTRVPRSLARHLLEKLGVKVFEDLYNPRTQAKFRDYVLDVLR